MWLFAFGTWYLSEDLIQLPPPDEADEQTVPLIHAGVVNLQTEPADTDQVQLNQKVIGITVGDKARAYLLAAMDTELRTVVNDLIEGTPVTVTYYPFESIEHEPETRVRVLVDEHGSAALVMGLAGIENGDMKIYCQEHEYLQMKSKIWVWHDENEDGERRRDEIHALVDHDFEVKTWGEWKKEHPETDIFLGKGTIGEVPPNL